MPIQQGGISTGPYLDCSSDYHDGIMQGPFRLFHELLCTPSQDYRASLCLRAACEEVIPANGTTQEGLR